MKILCKLNAVRVVAFLILSAPGFAMASTPGCENTTSVNSANPVSAIASASGIGATRSVALPESRPATPAVSNQTGTAKSEDPVLDDALKGVNDDYISSQL